MATIAPQQVLDHEALRREGADGSIERCFPFFNFLYVHGWFEHPDSMIEVIAWLHDKQVITTCNFEELRAKESASVVEVGSRARSGLSRRPMFKGMEYVGVDIMDGENVDIVGDAHTLSESVGRNRFDDLYTGFEIIKTHLGEPMHIVPTREIAIGFYPE